MSQRSHLTAAGLISLVFLAGGLLAESTRQMLRWSREAPAIEWLWRSWCAHWVHLDLNHALVNAAGFLLVAAWLSTAFTLTGWAIVIVAAIVAIDVGLWWLTRFEWYVGASAMIHALAAAGITVKLFEGERFSRWVALAGLLKLAYEQLAMPVALVGGATAAVDAHLFGVVAGALCGSVFASTGWCRARSVTLS
jgi:rhomboid family GlyGly-CTERM serine protease